MASIDVNGITIEYEREGAGEPLLMIMGLGAQLTAWPADLVSGLVGRGFEVIRFDNRDAGLSSETTWTPPSPVKAFLGKVFRRPVDTGYVIDDMADDAAGLLDALGIESAHVVGASMGGMIAQALTIRHEHRVRSLTSIMSNTGDRHGNAGPKVLWKLARRDEPTREEAVEQALATFELIGGPHFDVEVYRPLAEAAVARSYRPEGTRPADGGHHGQPRPDTVPPEVADADARDPRSGRSTRPPQRWHRHRQRGPRLTAPHVQRHGPRPPGDPGSTRSPTPSPTTPPDRRPLVTA